jgi:hypothetical protein
METAGGGGFGNSGAGGQTDLRGKSRGTSSTLFKCRKTGEAAGGNDADSGTNHAMSVTMNNIFAVAAASIFMTHGILLPSVFSEHPPHIPCP